KILGKNIHKWVIFLVAPFLLYFQVYLEPGAFALSIEDERILGQKFLIQVRTQYPIVDDDFANEYISALGHYLTGPLETRHFPFGFYIIKENDLNAFAGPGGHIFVLYGLIEAMDEVDDLASVMSHEIAHVSARHLAHRIEQSKKIGFATMVGVLAGMLIGGKAAAAIISGTQAAGIQAQLAYSRDDERQADQLGFKYMDGTGFDPSGMITALKKLEQGQWLGGDKIPTYLKTHPGGPERMANYESMLTHYTQKPENREVAKFRGLFPFFKTVLRAKCLEPRDAERLFNRELEKDSNSTLAHFGLGIVWRERSEYSKAIDQFQEALKRQPKSIPILRNLGEAYHLEGQDAEAIRVFEKALELNNQDKSALFLLAKSYQSTEKYKKAVRIYERLTLMKPVRPEVFYNLGVSYGRQNKLALAHYNFGIYFKKLGKMDKAGFHFQKADRLSESDPVLKSRIHKAMKEPH
ncbi:MAG: M48 family metalloprotease, partial [Desulfatiglandales bacterium]